MAQPDLGGSTREAATLHRASYDGDERIVRSEDPVHRPTRLQDRLRQLSGCRSPADDEESAGMFHDDAERLAVAADVVVVRERDPAPLGRVQQPLVVGDVALGEVVAIPLDAQAAVLQDAGKLLPEIPVGEEGDGIRPP